MNELAASKKKLKPKVVKTTAVKNKVSKTEVVNQEISKKSVSKENEPSKAWFVYILRCADNTLYTGVATDLDRRVYEHNHTQRGARYTRSRRPVVMVYSETVDSRSTACIRESVIKKLSRKAKTSLLRA